VKYDAAWRRHRRDELDASLDDLLGVEAPAIPAKERPWLFRSALVAFAAAAVGYTAFRAFDLAAPFPLLLAVCMGVVIIRRAVSVTAEPYPLRTRDLVGPPGPAMMIEVSGWYDGSDGAIYGVRTWEQRLDWAVSAPERFTMTVAGRLGELADERLRQRYGFTRADDPARAERLLGERLWILIHDEPQRVPSHRDVAAAIGALEQLWPSPAAPERSTNAGPRTSGP
jgi:hypothetical protein